MESLFVLNATNKNIGNNMPKVMERELKKEAKKKGLTGERLNAYVYGTMRKIGWTPSTQRQNAYKKLKQKVG